ncbi:MAG: SprT family zinc-dependent metalloprotease [Lachnospiraceae bacterium]|nr:SprT family zinc-dependent metalloprotease [Lachnospiraceae bacterium]
MRLSENTELDYQLIRSARRTVAIQIMPDGSVLVRAPKRCSRDFIEAFVAAKQEWILKKQQEVLAHRAELTARREAHPELSQEDYSRLQKQAAAVIARKTEAFAAVMQVTYGRITIRDQKSRWGSCSGKGNLNFNWRLILAPEEVLDYVVVHELAHRLEMNHSARFWQEVERVLPDYKARRLWLRKNGDGLMQM